MDILKEIEKGKIIPIIYSPDTIISNLIGHLDSFIQEKTNLKIYSRIWFKHTASSIERFYANSIQDNIPRWNLVSELFTNRPSLLTFWYGENNVFEATVIKGKSHPALAKKDTIRSLFWCDNPVSNLVHMSDNPNQAIREINIIKDFVNVKDLLSFNVKPKSYIEMPNIAHSGIITLINIIKRENLFWNINLPDIKIPDSGISLEVNEQLTKDLQAIKQKPFNDLIDNYLLGNSNAFINQISNSNCLTNWETLVLKCGVISREFWNKCSVDEIVKYIKNELATFDDWVISGSIAMQIHGFECKPNDLDIWCSEKTLREISLNFGCKIQRKETPFFSTKYFKISKFGWNIEFTGKVKLNNEQYISVDADMLKNANDFVEPAEDLIAELIAINRPFPKSDLERAFVFSSSLNKMNSIYLTSRLAKWNIPNNILTILKP